MAKKFTIEIDSVEKRLWSWPRVWLTKNGKKRKINLHQIKKNGLTL